MGEGRGNGSKLEGYDVMVKRHSLILSFIVWWGISVNNCLSLRALKGIHRSSNSVDGEHNNRDAVSLPVLS